MIAMSSQGRTMPVVSNTSAPLTTSPIAVPECTAVWASLETVTASPLRGYPGWGACCSSEGFTRCGSATVTALTWT